MGNNLDTNLIWNPFLKEASTYWLLFWVCFWVNGFSVGFRVQINYCSRQSTLYYRCGRFKKMQEQSINNWIIILQSIKAGSPSLGSASVSAECQRLGCHFAPCCCITMTTDTEITAVALDRSRREDESVTHTATMLMCVCGMGLREQGQLWNETATALQFTGHMHLGAYSQYMEITVCIIWPYATHAL